MGDNSFHLWATLKSFWHDLVWAVMPGTVIKVPCKEGTVVVGHDHPRWYDVGASFVEAWSDDPHDHYGPWLTAHVGKEFFSWQMRRCINASWQEGYEDIQVNEHVEIKIRDPHWATVAVLAFK